MNQDSLKEPNQSPEVSNSEEFYTVNSVIKDLEGVDPWNLDDFDKDLINWTDSQFFEQSEYQNRYFVINSQVTPYRQLRQAMMEIQSRLNCLQKTNISYKRCLNDIERVKHEMEQETDPFEKKDKGFELDLLYCDKQIWLNKIRQGKHEISGLMKIIKEREDVDVNSTEKLKQTISDKNVLEAEEHKYWIARMAKQSAIDLLTTGRIQSGNLDSMLMMSPEDQAAVADLALTYSTAMNRSIGGIKEAAEQRVDRMLDGKPPQMFDTAGVLTDYATNNITDRLIQSADKPKT